MTVLVWLALKRCSPLRRGWPLGCAAGPGWLGVLPAQAGVAPVSGSPVHAPTGAPRSGGGGPYGEGGIPGPGQCSPLRRGWPLGLLLRAGSRAVLPAQAGVAPSCSTSARHGPCAPRSGGGGPSDAPPYAGARACSPLRRGWPLAPAGRRRTDRVLPAQAGVALTSFAGIMTSGSAPRSGGGGPKAMLVTSERGRCSPLRRGWPLVGERLYRAAGVLPAQAGVAPSQRPAGRTALGAPRSGGGGPWGAG